jgi:hypothetical protein
MRPFLGLPSPPEYRGRGVGGEGDLRSEFPTPSPQPLSPEYEGEGLSEHSLNTAGLAVHCDT